MYRIDTAENVRIFRRAALLWALNAEPVKETHADDPNVETSFNHTKNAPEWNARASEFPSQKHAQITNVGMAVTIWGES